MALLSSLYTDRWRPASGFAAALRRSQPQVAPCRDDGGLARKRRQDPDQQRGILPPVSPGARGYGCPPPADGSYGSYGFLAGRRAPLVSRTIRTRQPDRLAAEHPRLPGVCPRNIGDPRLIAGKARG